MSSGFCAFNLSIGIFVTLEGRVTNIKNNQIVGIAGKHYDHLLVTRNDRKCIFKPIHELESQYFLNESNDYLMNRDLLDLYVRPEELGHQRANVEVGLVIGNIRMTAAQVLGDPKHQATDFLSFLYKNLTLVLMIVFGGLMTRLVAFLFLETLYSNQTRRMKWFSLKILFLTCRQATKQLPKLAILFLSLTLFKFILLSLLANTIKTTKVVIDTSFLIDSVEKLASTDKKPIFVEHGSEYKLIFEAPKGTELFRLFNRILTQKGGFYLISRRSFGHFFPCLDYLGTLNYFLFMSRALVIYLLNVVTSFFSRVFFNNQIFYETASVLYVRKNLNTRIKRKLLRKLRNAFEAGLVGNLMGKVEKSLISDNRKGSHLFTHTDELLEEFNSIEDVRLENYRNLFLIYFCFTFLVLFGFVLFKTRNLTKKILLRFTGNPERSRRVFKFMP